MSSGCGRSVSSSSVEMRASKRSQVSSQALHGWPSAAVHDKQATWHPVELDDAFSETGAATGLGQQGRVCVLQHCIRCGTPSKYIIS